VASIIDVGKTFFQRGKRRGRRCIDAVASVVAAGRTHPWMLPNLAEGSRPDGSRGPWHDNLGPAELWLELVTLRNACCVLAAVLLMMRALTCA
jgi:hypothetical protein